MKRQYQSGIVDGLHQLVREAVREELQSIREAVQKEIRAALVEYDRTRERASATVGRIGMRVEDACEATGIGETILRAAIRTGQLRARKRGRSLIVLQSDLQAYLDALPPVPRLSLVS
jgi:hypothetical protein